MVSYAIIPIGKPRMTQKDKWSKRQCVIRYWEFKDACRKLGVELIDGSHITFIIPLPKGLPKKEKDARRGQPHRMKPDIDNLAKALLDAVHDEDSHIHDIRLTKLWGDVGEIRIEHGR